MIATLLLTGLVVQASSYRVDTAVSEAGFDLKATLHTVHGSTTVVTGEVRVAPADDGVLTLSGAIEIGAATLHTGNEKRDAKLRESSLRVASYPKIVFVPERFVPNGPAGGDGTMAGRLSGRLTIRETTKHQEIEASLTPRGERILVSGTFDVTWAEFGVPDPSFFVVRVEPVAHAHFRAEFIPVP